MQESSPGLPIAVLVGVSRNSGRIVGANLMPSAQYPQKSYTRRQFFEFLRIFLTWLSVADKNNLHILNHNPMHTFLKKLGKSLSVSLVSLIVCLTNCLALRTTLLSYWLYIKRCCHLVKECAKWMSLSDRLPSVSVDLELEQLLLFEWLVPTWWTEEFLLSGWKECP